MIPVVIYLSIGLLVFLFLLFSNVVDPSIEEDNLNMVIVSWVSLFILCLVLWPVVLSLFGLIIKALHEKKKYKYIEGFGLLRIKKTWQVDSDNNPTLFLATSKAGDSLIGLMTCDDENTKQYLYLPVSKHRLALMMTGFMDVRNAFIKAEGGKVLSVLRDKETKNEYNEWVVCEDIPINHIPESGVFICH